MLQVHPNYQRHQPERTVLHQLLQDHWPLLKQHLAEADIYLPRFVENDFDGYLRCGLLEHGFLRVKCNGCRHEHLVAFSCKMRGFCPSCGARRMVETSAHLVDNVLPDVPVRQWVLTFPWPLRLLFARQPQALSGCLKIIQRALETHLIHRAGLSRKHHRPQGGMVTLVQHFGSALNLNVHVHLLVPDGVYTVDDEDYLRFHAAAAPSRAEMTVLLDRIVARLVGKLERSGHLVAEAEQPWLDFDPDDPLLAVTAACIRYRIAIGPHSGSRVMTLNNPALAKPGQAHKPFTVNRDGFSLNAAMACRAEQRDKLERLVRYVTRPALCLERLSLRNNGQVQYTLKHPFRDGTCAVVFSPLDFVAKLAALVPRPRHHLVRYHGVLAPNARLRRYVVPERDAKSKPRQTSCGHSPDSRPLNRQGQPRAPLNWAERLKRVFQLDITICPNCGGRLRVIADVTDPTVIRRILDHVAAQPPPLTAKPAPRLF
jgi:hypothetical protein